jgi:hypothetical protein
MAERGRLPNGDARDAVELKPIVGGGGFAGGGGGNTVGGDREMSRGSGDGRDDVDYGSDERQPKDIDRPELQPQDPTGDAHNDVDRASQDLPRADPT